MVISKSTIERIKRVLKNNYAKLAMGILGAKNLSDEDRFYLQRDGVDIENQQSLLDAIYNYNYINDAQDPTKPDNLEEALAQQANPAARPQGQAHEASYEHLNSNMHHLIEKHRNDIISRIEGLIRDNNNDYKYDALQNLDRPDRLDEIVKQSTVGDLKRELRDLSKDANRNWTRIAVTETSNAIGMGSVDRLVKDNRKQEMEDVYVYRINPNDSATCLEEDELVEMYDGSYKRVGELEVGDSLRSPRNGSNQRNHRYLNKVTYINRAKKEVFEYELKDGRTLRCTEDHPILIKVDKKVMFFPIGLLENSTIQYKVLNENSLTIGDRFQISQIPAFIRELGYEDEFYFLHENLENMKKLYLTGESLRSIHQNLDISSSFDSFKKWMSIVLRLSGINIKKVSNKKRAKAMLHNTRSKKYSQNKKQLNREKCREAIKVIEKSKEKLEKSIKAWAKYLGVSPKTLTLTMKKENFALFKEIKIAGRKRANTKMRENPLNVEKLAKAAAKKLSSNKKASKPQKILFNRLREYFPKIELEKQLLNRISADIFVNNVVVEYDGSGHFMMGRNNPQKDFARDTELKKAGYSVLRIKASADNIPEITKIVELIKELANKRGSYVEVVCD